eukprot:gene27893-36747_t
MRRGSYIIALISILALPAILYGWVPTPSRLTHTHIVKGEGSLRMSDSDAGLIPYRSVTPIKLGGKVVVSGLRGFEEDEFFLNLLNEQNIWDLALLAVDEEASERKRFLTRSARYSGLLNILDFKKSDLTNDSSVDLLLANANAWIAFNVPQSSVPRLVDRALANQIKRAIFTVELPPSSVKETVIPEFAYAIDAFNKSGASFTGVRHGAVVAGDEDNAYDIVNGSVPLITDQVEAGVLGRVVAELLSIDVASNKDCGVSSSNAFAAAYLNILRQSGLTRKQEVAKLFTGGVQRVAQLTARSYQAKAQQAEEAKQLSLRRDEEEKLRLQQEIEKGPVSLSKDVDFDEEGDEEETDELRIKIRTQEILTNVWREYDTRMYTKSTSKNDFFETNKERAMALATKEIMEENEQRKQKAIEKDLELKMADTLLDVNRVQYSKLLALERKEILNQKEISDSWVKYIFLLLEVTMERCQDKNILFHNLDEFQQTLLLRSIANDLRKTSGLMPFDVIYDSFDASEIVSFVLSQEGEDSLAQKFGLQRPAEEIHAVLEAKYGEALKNIAALRGANQIIQLAIETLRKELPIQPPSVNELRRSESLSKQQLVSAARLETTRNRGKPFSEGSEKVGKI